MTDDIDRIAAALWESERGTVSYDWTEISEAARSNWLRLARVALVAMQRCPRCGGAPRDVYGTSIVACTDCGRYLGQQRMTTAAQEFDFTQEEIA